jgi:hypothetical protein
VRHDFLPNPEIKQYTIKFKERMQKKKSIDVSWTIGSDTIIGSQEGCREIIHIGLKNNFRSELDTTLLPKTLRR